MEENILQTKKVKLQDIAKITTGLPLQRYIGKEDVENYKIIMNMPILEVDEEFPTSEEELAKDINKRFYSKEHDILYKVQQKCFAKEVTTETDAIITNSYLIEL